MTDSLETQSDGLAVFSMPSALADSAEGAKAAFLAGRAGQGVSNVVPFDFRQPPALLPGDLRRLRLQHERFLGHLSETLSSLFRQPCQLGLDDLSLAPCGLTAPSRQGRAHSFFFSLEPLRGAGVLQIGHPLAQSVVDSLRGKSGAAPARANLSEIEKALLEEFAAVILGEWAGSWNQSTPLKATMLDLDSHGEFAGIAPKDTLKLAVTMSFQSAGAKGSFLIAIPHFSVDRMIKDLRPAASPAEESPVVRIQARDGAEAAASHASLLETPVSVSAKWPGLEMSARDVMNLRVGQVMRLAPGAAASVEVTLGEMPGFHGRPGTLGGDWAVELTGSLND